MEIIFLKSFQDFTCWNFKVQTKTNWKFLSYNSWKIVKKN